MFENASMNRRMLLTKMKANILSFDNIRIAVLSKLACKAGHTFYKLVRQLNQSLIKKMNIKSATKKKRTDGLRNLRKRNKCIHNALSGETYFFLELFEYAQTNCLENSEKIYRKVTHAFNLGFHGLIGTYLVQQII
jgi:hypothetical protein